MKDKILVVDDEREIADLIALYLSNENCEVITYDCGKDALDVLRDTEYDLALLDIMLPDSSGFDLLGEIRKRYTYPVIMLTAKDEETDKITGLTLGADDYMTKPFRPLELVARVKAQLRRYKRYNTPQRDEGLDAIFEHNGLVMNTRTHVCFLNEKELSLTPTEFSILQILLSNRGTVVSAEELFRRIWQDTYYTKNNNTITVHIRHLREKMNDTVESPKYIKTVWGVGYKIET